MKVTQSQCKLYTVVSETVGQTRETGGCNIF